MTAAGRQAAIEFVLEEEGKTPRIDSGRLTVWGVDVESLAAVLEREVKLDELEALDRELAARILSRRWDALQLDNYPSGLDYLVFDCCTVCGRAVTLQWLSIALSRVVFSEHIPYETLVTAARGCSEERTETLIAQLISMRRRRAKMHVDWRHWRNVWTNRTNRVERRVIAMVEGAKNAKPNGVGTEHAVAVVASDDWSC